MHTIISEPYPHLHILIKNFVTGFAKLWHIPAISRATDAIKAGAQPPYVAAYQVAAMAIAVTAKQIMRPFQKSIARFRF